MFVLARARDDQRIPEMKIDLAGWLDFSKILDPLSQFPGIRFQGDGDDGDDTTSWMRGGTASAERWRRHCERMEEIVRADPPPSQAAGLRVFGRCPRCRGARIDVITKQLRRTRRGSPWLGWGGGGGEGGNPSGCADEGMTEIRTCKDCGHTTRVNS